MVWVSWRVPSFEYLLIWDGYQVNNKATRDLEGENNNDEEAQEVKRDRQLCGVGF